MDGLISRQAAIDIDGLDVEIRCEMCKNPMHTDRGCDGNCKYDEKLYERIMQILGERIKPLPSAQPEITEEQAIEHLQSTGWMQNHDREMYESGLRERLADDSDSYDALLPPAQPEEDCDTCKHGYFGDDKCNNCRVRYPSHYERRTK